MGCERPVEHWDDDVEIAGLIPLYATIFSNNVRLFAYVFTGWDPQKEWLKRDETKRVYWFKIGFLSLVYL